VPALTFTQQIQRAWVKTAQWASHPFTSDRSLEQWRQALATQNVAQVQRLVTLNVLPAEGAQALAPLAWELLRQHAPSRITLAYPAWDEVQQERQRQENVEALVGGLWQAGLDPQSPDPHDPRAPTLIEAALLEGQTRWYRALRQHRPEDLNRTGSQGWPLYLGLVINTVSLKHRDECWEEIRSDLRTECIQPNLVGRAGENLVRLAMDHRASSVAMVCGQQWRRTDQALRALPPEQVFQSHKHVNIAEWLGQNPLHHHADQAGHEIGAVLHQLCSNGYAFHFRGWGGRYEPLHKNPHRHCDYRGRTPFHAWLKHGPLSQEVCDFFLGPAVRSPTDVPRMDWDARDDEGNTPLHALMSRKEIWDPKWASLADQLFRSALAATAPQPRLLLRGLMNRHGETVDAMIDKMSADWPAEHQANVARYHGMLVALRRQAQAEEIKLADQTEKAPSSFPGAPPSEEANRPPRRRLRT
jgi:hypothetical protein